MQTPCPKCRERALEGSHGRWATRLASLEAWQRGETTAECTACGTCDLVWVTATACLPAIWAVLPADAQRMLSGHSSTALDLHFNDDGTPLQTPARSGEALFLCIVGVHAGNIHDAIRVATELTESLVRAEKK
jgi:hypothetical protein